MDLRGDTRGMAKLRASRFLLVVPIEAYDRLVAWGRDLEAAADPAAVEQDRERLERRLREWLEDPTLLEAIWSGSAGIHGPLSDWLAGRSADVPPFARVLSKVAGRPNSVGLMAGTSLGRFDTPADLALPDPAGQQRFAWPEPAILGQVIQALRADPRRREEATLRPNPTLQIRGDVVSMITWTASPDQVLVAPDGFESDEVLTGVLERARGGLRRVELIAVLVEDGFPEEEATTFIDELIDEQILDMGLPFPVPEASADLFPGWDGTSPLPEWGEGVLAEANATATWPVASHLVRDGEPRLPPAVVEEIVGTLEALAGVLPEPAEAPVVARFRENFGEGPVPLALVAEVGLGRPYPHLLFLDGDPGPRLRDQLQRGLRDDAEEIGLDPADWPGPASVPAGVGVAATVAATSMEALERGDFEVLLTRLGGAPGIQMAEAPLPEAATPWVQQMLRDLGAAGIECPEMRPGRGASSDAPWPTFDPLLPPSEWAGSLEVTIQRGGLVLHDRRTGNRVVPWAAVSSGFHYKGVGALDAIAWVRSQADRDVPRFGWGDLESRRFLPRVRLGRTILRRARWTVPGERVEGLWGTRGAEAYHAIQELREEFGIPRFVTFIKNRMVHPLDLENILSIEGMTGLTKGVPVLVLEEPWPDPSRLLVRGPDGGHVHEMLVPLIANEQGRP